jgi:threonine dehydratase
MQTRAFDPAEAAALSLADFEQAAAAIASDILRTPMLPYMGQGGSTDILLKPENMQPLGSFKIRCAANAASVFGAAANGRISTASAGNFAQGLALACSRRGIALTVHVPATAARIKVSALGALGARVIEHPFDDWWSIMTSRDTGSDDGLFIHPVCETSVVAGNGTIGLEIAQDAPDVETVVIPYGGGGLTSGVALALRAAGHRARIVAVEVETSTPYAAARGAGAPVAVTRHPSFIDGIGSTGVLDAMWPLVSTLVDDHVTVTVDEVRSALRSAMVDNHIVLEGAGAAALAGAIKLGSGRVCAILSGGNIDPAVHAEQVAAAPPPVRG